MHATAAPTLLDRIPTMAAWQLHMVIHNPIRPSQAELEAALDRREWLRLNPPKRKVCHSSDVCLCEGIHTGADGATWCRVHYEMENEPGGRYF